MVGRVNSRDVKRLARRSLSTEERRQEIVTTSAELFDDAGYSSTTMEDISRAVGIAKPTLYHYFAGKEEILFSIHEEFIDLLISRHEQRLGRALSPEHLLLEVMADILELMESHRGHVRVFFEHYRELPALHRETIRVKRDHYEAMIEDIFVGGIEANVFHITNPKLATLAMFGMCNWAYQWYQRQGPMHTRDIAYVFWDFLVHGVAVGRPTGPGAMRLTKPA